MANTINLSIRECEHAVKATLDSFLAPIEAKRLILQNLLFEVTMQANTQVNIEAEEINNNKEKEKEDGT